MDIDFQVNNGKVLEFQKQQLSAIQAEEKAAGGYDYWYYVLAPFRNYIKNRYIRFGIASKVYRPKTVVTDNGDIIDHHTISYLAPMEFTRIGWDGKKLKAHEQVKKISDYFAERGKRFIYVALPNKGNIYPELVCNDSKILRIFWGGGVLGNAPQWRKYVKEVLKDGVETLDIFPVFMRTKKAGCLFSKEHHISAFGAETVGKEIARYIKQTTGGIPESLEICSEKVDLYCSDYGEPDCICEPACVYYINPDGRKTYYWNQYTEGSKIAIFGDCNLQSYSSHGAGISSVLSYELNYPIYNAGRKLIFGLAERPITKRELEQLLRYDIVIYVHFASAPFVRSAALLSLRHPVIGYKWVNFNLDK